MKNKIFAMALIALSLVSCTKNDDLQPTKSVETTKVAFNVNADNGVSATGKLIDKSAVPLYVDNLTINAVSPYPSCNVSDTFTFGTSTATNPLANGFGLSNVAIGTNIFTASSGAADANKRLTLNGADWDLAKGHIPYITCASAPVTQVIKKVGNDPVNLTMTTNNGRVLAKFVQEANDADNYMVKVTATIGSWSKTETVNPFTVFEWSNENAVDGATVTFTFNIYEKVIPGTALGQVLNTITKTVSVQKAKSILATYTIHNTDVHTDIADGKIVLTFPTIEDVIIND